MPALMRGEHLLFEATDRQHPPTKRDLAGHRHVVPDAYPREHRDEGGEHRDTRARSVLGHASGRNVDMDVALLEKVLRYPVVLRVRPDVGERRLCGLFHDVPELPRELELTGAEHSRSFDEENLTADACPREARGNPRFLGALGDFACELLRLPRTRECCLRRRLCEASCRPRRSSRRRLE